MLAADSQIKILKASVIVMLSGVEAFSFNTHFDFAQCDVKAIRESAAIILITNFASKSKPNHGD